jgi:hypothetical protein
MPAAIEADTIPKPAFPRQIGVFQVPATPGFTLNNLVAPSTSNLLTNT